MAKIAAIILPSSRAAGLPDLGQRMSRSLCLYSAHRVESETYYGVRAACMLLRVAPDPLNPRPQPVDCEKIAGVACGYYLSPDQSGGDSASRLVADLATDGLAALPRADGVYAFAWWDRQRECLVTGVDKLGMRPLYWAALPGGGYAVASEIKALVALMDDLKTNWAAWEEHLTFGFLFGEHTFLKGVERLGVAESITFRHDRHDSCVIEDFLETIDVVDRPLAAFLEDQGAAFDGAMSQLASLYDSGRDTMLTLSGGFDSRRALGWLLNRDIRPTAYTVPEVKRDGWEFESSIVREMCRNVGMEGYSIYPATVADRIQVRLMRDLATDFQSDEHNCSTILAMGLNCHDKVNFDGLAAGSQLSGSFVTGGHFEPGGRERFITGLPQSVRTWLNLPESDAPPLEARVRAELDRWGDNPNRFAYFYLLSRTRREIALAPLSVQANVFESLCPFLDRAVMRSALSFPPVRKIGANMQMRLIAAMHPKLGQLPTVHSPGAADDARYRVYMGKVERGARRKLLRQASGVRDANAAWSFGAQQRLRFQGASALAAFGGDARLRWEFGKAAKVGQLAHFEAVSRSPEHYQSAVESSGAAFGKRVDWCKPL